MLAFPKIVMMESPTYLAWVRTQPCFSCGQPLGTQAHHWPPRGRRRVVDDTKTTPLCAQDHLRAHGSAVVKSDGRTYHPPSRDEQEAACDKVFRRFMFEAPTEVFDKVIAELRANREARGL